MAAFLSFLRAFLLAVVLFPVGLAMHEVMHLAVYSAFGVRAVLLVTSWKLGLVGTPIFGLHAAPAVGDPPLRVLVVNNGLGPALAAVPLLVLWASVGRRARVARAALLANVLVLIFFSCIELAYPLLEEVAHVDADVLLLPELNYGGVLLIMLATTSAAIWRGRPGRRLRLMSGSPGPGRPFQPPAGGSPPGRLPAR
ncbi:MAG TPA: hypothetical protein VGO86_18515 [Candidatus Dormibacteraeota bacterium]|jgi:hypothetical protein